MTRDEAIQRGLTRYYTGTPCKYGHVAERKVSNRKCAECARLSVKARRESSPERRAESKTRLKTWKGKHPGKMRTYLKATYQRHPDRAHARWLVGRAMVRLRLRVSTDTTRLALYLAGTDPDYSRPYDVDWLCREHHEKVHQTDRSIEHA